MNLRPALPTFARLLFAISLFLLAALPSMAQKPIDQQTQNGVIKYFGIDKNTLSPERWNANWIWRPGETFASNVMLCARKTFTLTRRPAASKLYITGDSQYSLWVNGEFINRGPLRSAPHHQSFDILDISAKLKPGKNVLAIKVHHSGNIISYADKIRPGLLFQLEIPEDKLIISSDRSCKVRNETGWDTITPQLHPSNLAHIENFNFNKSALGWEQPDFDDSDWENAVLIRHLDWWPARKPGSADYANMPPWYNLVPRDTRYLEETLRPVKAVFETGECAEFGAGRSTALREHPIFDMVQHRIVPLKHCKVENMGNFLAGKGELTIQNTSPKGNYSNEPFRSTWIVFDMGELVMGYPRLEIHSESGTNVDIAYAATLMDGTFVPGSYPDNVGDAVVFPGRKVTWEAQELRTFRYIGLLVSNTDEPVTISYAGIKQTAYPFGQSKPASFGDPFLDKLYKASDRTLRMVTSDVYTDNYKERRQYIQTGFYASKGNYSLFGDPYLSRRLLMQIAEDQFPNGFFPMHAPGRPKQGILESDLMWHMTLYDYFMYTGDKATTSSLLINLKRNLTAFEELSNRDGLIENPSHPYWIDHTNLDLRGINFTINSWYMVSLEKDARLFKYFGLPADAAACSQKAQKIRAYLKTKFWNADKGLFVQTEVDGKQTKLYDEISNGMAMLTGIAGAAQSASISEKILRNDNTHEMVRPVLMMSWPIEGMFRTGHGKEAIEVLKTRYKAMMEYSNPTLWEGWNLYSFNQGRGVVPKIRSATQAEQVYHPYVYAKYILGVEGIKPGMTKVKISYHDLALQNRSGEVPTPSGNIKINWSVSGTNGRLTVTSPKNIKIVIDEKSLPAHMRVTKMVY